MAEDSFIVLDGFALRSNVDIVRYPDRYCDERGTQMWGTVSRILDDLESPICAYMYTPLCVSAPLSPLIFLWLYLKYIFERYRHNTASIT